MKESFESFEIMLNELNSSLELNKLRENKIKELEEKLEKLKKENVYLKNDLIFMNTLKSFK
jgi:cupin superfamily acireductone dioxygenase involved in methionine salvage